VNSSTQATPLDGADGAPGREELIALADRSLAAYLRYLAGYGGSVAASPGLLVFAGAHRQPNPYRNGVLRLDAGLMSAPEVIEAADAYFAQRRGGYVVWAREHGDADLEALARRAQLSELDRLPELDTLPAYLPPPAGVELRPVSDAATREDYLAVVADAWGMGSMPREVSARVFFDPDSLAVENVCAFVAYFEGWPLSAAMTYLDGDVALGCQAATIRRPKRGQPLPRTGAPGAHRGLAESCLWASLRESFEDKGARISLCQTSQLGAPVWQAFGYRPFTSYGRYLVPRPGAAR
jgi:hypothetical protein